MRDEIIAVFSKYNCTNYGGIPNDIIAIFQRRLDEILMEFGEFCDVVLPRIKPTGLSVDADIPEAQRRFATLCTFNAPEPKPDKRDEDMTLGQARQIIRKNNERRIIEMAKRIKDGDTND